MRHAAERLKELGVAFDSKIVSAHRTPDRLVAFAKGARDAGYKVIVAGAGGAAHLPGMVAAMTTLPVLGVPIEIGGAQGAGQPLFHRADAGGSPGGDAGHRQARGQQCRAARRRHPGDGGRRARRPARSWRKAQAEAVAEHPADDDAAE